MRTRLLSAAATALSATAFAAEPPPYLPGGPAKPSADAPALVPIAPPAPKADCDCNCNLTGGSTGLRPGIDCLPPPCAVRKPKPRLYGELEYVLTWFDDRSPPPLVGSGPPVFPLALVFPPPPPAVLYGGEPTDFGGIDGLRATAGYWLDDQQNLGIEASGFLTERTGTGFAASHDGAANNPVVLGRIVPTFVGPQLGPLVGIPGITQGGIAVAERTRLWGAEANAIAKGTESCNGRFDVLAGFRYLDLDESLATATTTQSTFFPTVISSADNFAARTQFYGGQIGARVRADFGRATASATAKLGLGVSHQAVNRTGVMTTAGPFTSPGDILVPSPNRDTTDKFAVVPEGLFKVGYRLTERLEVTAGYSILYLSSAARAADQVNDGFAAKRGIDSTDFVAQGISLGLGYRY